MNVAGIYQTSRNLPESNSNNVRYFERKKTVQDKELKWLQTMYETYSRHLNYFEGQLKVVSNILKQKELTELIEDAKQHIAEINKKITNLSVK